MSNLFDKAEHLAGETVDMGAQVVGRGLDAVGYHDTARQVSNLGDQAATSMGVDVPEKSLDETSDPKELVRGDVEAIHATADHLRKFANAATSTGQALSAIDTTHWEGKAANGFRSLFNKHPQLWGKAARAFTTMATTWTSYASTVEWAQQQAHEAATMYQQGKQQNAAAQAQHVADVKTYNNAAKAANAAIASGQQPAPVGPMPSSRPPQPGTEACTHAQQMLAQARQQRDTAANQAAAAFTSTVADAPPLPPKSVQDNIHIADESAKGGVLAEHVVGGLAKGLGEGLKFGRRINPADPYNISHVGEYVDNVSTSAAGIAGMGTHPEELVKGFVGTKWRSDPGEAFGQLLSNFIGPGGAAKGVARGAMHAAEHGAEGAVERTAGRAAEHAATPRPHEVPTPKPSSSADAAAERATDVGGRSLDRVEGELNRVQTHEPSSGGPTAHTDTPPGAHEAPPTTHNPPGDTGRQAVENSGAGLDSAEKHLDEVKTHDPGAVDRKATDVAGTHAAAAPAVHAADSTAQHGIQQAGGKLGDAEHELEHVKIHDPEAAQKAEAAAAPQSRLARALEGKDPSVAKTDNELWHQYLTKGDDGKDILINKPKLTNQHDLDMFEARKTTKRLNALEARLDDFAHMHPGEALKEIHGHTFQDVYDFAGKPRECIMGKSREWGYEEYARRDLQEPLLDAVDDAVNKRNILDAKLPDDQWNKNLAGVWGTLHKTHLFREGNTRTIGLYMESLANRAGRHIDLGAVPYEEFLEARGMHAINNDAAPLADVIGRMVTHK